MVLHNTDIVNVNSKSDLLIRYYEHGAHSSILSTCSFVSFSSTSHAFSDPIISPPCSSFPASSSIYFLKYQDSEVLQGMLNGYPMISINIYDIRHFWKNIWTFSKNYFLTCKSTLSTLSHPQLKLNTWKFKLDII